jgi:hypothetical protein
VTTWEHALVEKRPKDTSGFKGRIRLAWFKHRRRTLEARLFSYGQVHLWHVVRDQNDAMGVWRRWV